MTALPEPTPRSAGIDALLAEVRLRARLRLAWMSHLREGERTVALLDDRDSPEEERAWRGQTPELTPLLAALASLEPPGDTPLAHLADVLELGDPERRALELALAAALDPDVRELCGLLSGRGRPSWPDASVVARLYGLGRTLLLSEAHPIRAWQVLDVGDDGTLRLEPGLARWLAGEPVLTDALVDAAIRVAPRPALDGWPVDETVTQLRRILEGGEGCFVRVSGPPGVGRRTFAALVAERLGLGLLAVDPPSAEPSTVARHAERQAWLDALAIAWVTAPPRRHCPRLVPLQFVLDGPGHHPELPGDRPVLAVELRTPAVAERQRLWRSLVPGATSWPDDELTALSVRHHVTVGDVHRAARLAPADAEGAARGVREAMRGALGDIAQPLTCPFLWDDLVLPVARLEMLHDLAHEARQRSVLWERPALHRLFPQGRGLLALFTGPPGTGKTMAAQVVARDLGLDLFRIDLSQLVSKYVGETSKNIERVLSAAERLDVVLLFDEADALFGRRTEIHDAHDRFANTDTNYLLQAIESWSGVAILATNQRNNLDAAFVRRLRHVLDFPMPDVQCRRDLWRRLFVDLTGQDAAPTGLDQVADAVPLSGAQIKNALLTAVITAEREGAPPRARHLVGGVQRELLKVGRGLSRSDRERLEDAAR